MHAQLRRLRDTGLLRAPSTALPPVLVGRPLTAFVTLSVDHRHVDAVDARLRAVPEVVEAHTVTGDADLQVRVVARDPHDLHRVTQLLQSVPGVQRSNTSVAITEVIGYTMTPLLRHVVDQA